MRATGPVLRLVVLLGGLAACADRLESPSPLLTITTAPAGFPRPPVIEVNDVAPGTAMAEARARLGRRLFFDPRLSRTETVSCSTCHRPGHGFADVEAVSAGVDGRRGNRNAPALINIAWTRALFWDGRVTTLEEQTGKPLENPDEMDLPLSQAVGRLEGNASYRQAFIDAYPGRPTDEALRRALAAFIRILVSGQSPYDRFLRGDATALAPAAQRGMRLFFTDKGGCFHCHPSGPLTNDGFFNNGSYVAGGDVGRQAVTGRTGDLGKFKVPGLRNIAATAPYMHDGSVTTLEDVVEQYARGGRGGPSTDAIIVPLSLTADEKSDLVAFLRALTDEAFLEDPRFREDPPER